MIADRNETAPSSSSLSLSDNPLLGHYLSNCSWNRTQSADILSASAAVLVPRQFAKPASFLHCLLLFMERSFFGTGT